jgi:NAD+ kinase
MAREGGRRPLPPKRVGLAVKLASGEAVALGRRLVGELARRGAVAVVEREAAQALGCAPGPPRSELGREVDLVLVLGGDGTFLAAARGCPARTPVCGINLGSLGFLTEHAPQGALELLERVFAGTLVVEQRDRLEVRVGGDGAGQRYLVLNDVAINKAALARIVSISVEVDGEFLSRYRADGLILATPTGSTAYNLSAWGPILHPALGALLITPICSHDLANRPLAVPMDCTVSAWVQAGAEEVYVTLDGQVGFPLAPGVRVSVTRSGEPLSLVREPTSSFFSILHQKLKWGDREE